jgi:hypothetical protein
MMEDSAGTQYSYAHASRACAAESISLQMDLPNDRSNEISVEAGVQPKLAVSVEKAIPIWFESAHKYGSRDNPGCGDRS